MAAEILGEFHVPCQIFTRMRGVAAAVDVIQWPIVRKVCTTSNRARTARGESPPRPLYQSV